MAVGDPNLVPLPPFSAITVVNRLALTIQPSAAPEQYYIAVGADPSKVDPQRLVSGGQLTLSSKSAGVGYGGQVTVGLPPERFSSYTSSGDTDSFVAGGFKTNSLNVTLNGNANLTLKNISVQNLFTAQTNGIAKLVVTGNLPNVQIRTTGNTYTYLSGFPGNVDFHMSGSCSGAVDGTQNTHISGLAQGSCKVVYNDGQCSMSGGHWPGAPCPCHKGNVPPPPF